MGMTIDGRKVERVSCDDCGESYTRVWGFIYEEGDAHSAYFADCHGHPEVSTLRAR
jgi:hypothetical protein